MSEKRNNPYTLDLIYGMVDRITKLPDIAEQAPGLWQVYGYACQLVEMAIKQSDDKCRLDTYLCDGPILRDPPVDPEELNQYSRRIAKHMIENGSQLESNLFWVWACHVVTLIKERLDGILPMGKDPDFPARANKWFFQGAQMARDIVEIDYQRAMYEK